ncbi:hypothetical protein F0344_08495 [Streptomyces finlayi]|uniref:Uncharacterized protein n=1 Tax=Streptomyces finlayi TaxID=67296 RepID=A0A7G7BH30_9ACTN|nr:hypothetical protein [Streptomyces finlayi]QNE74645.1 hypothetical protein F0344_08495 [Streptomyces finlayi]
MLNPIRTAAVIRDGRASGAFPGEIHEGVSWWVASCFVVVSKTSRLVLAHDGEATSLEFADGFQRGAMNAQHWACEVSNLGAADERTLLRVAAGLGGVPAALIATAQGDVGGETVTISLFGSDGQSVEEDHLAEIREMIETDNVPIPVNEGAKGRVVDRRDLVAVQDAAA